MQTQQNITESWWQFTNPYSKKHANYKLHVAIPVAILDQHYQKLQEILKKATEDGVIHGFKILNRGSSETLISELGGEHVTVKENSNARLYNNPITIYLYEDLNPSYVFSLCQQLENYLKDVPPSNPAHLSKADILLMPHISMRQEKLNNNYVAIAHATDDDLALLNKQLSESQEFKQLTNEIKKAAETSKVDEVEQAKAIENSILGFYQSVFKHFDRALHSKNIIDQVRAACNILQIDEKEFNSNILAMSNSKTGDINAELLKKISKQFRLKSLKFHPDKVATLKLNNSTTLQKAREIFNLMNDAKTILETVVSKPELIDVRLEKDEGKGLKQDEYIPRYEYELADGYEEDPYYYVYHLATSDRYVRLRKNWEIEESPILEIDNGTDSSNSIVLQIYHKKKKMYDSKTRKIEIVPAYEAFYKLWSANALAYRFNHYDAIFYTFDKPLNKAQCWLARKALTVPEFAIKFSPYDINNLAIQATKEGVIQIGTTPEAVFEYIYKTMPEAVTIYFIQTYLYKRPGSELTPIITDPKPVIKMMLNAPENLKQIDADALSYLCKYDADIRKYVYTRKEYFEQLKHSFDEYQFFQPLFEMTKSEVDALGRDVLKQLIHGDTTVLAIVSTEVLGKYKDYLTKHSELNENWDGKTPIVPSWLINDIDQELKQRAERTNDFTLTSNTCLKTLYFVKQQFLADNVPLIQNLSKESLIWLSTEPEITWHHYLPIAHQLIQLGEDALASRYLNRISNELKLDLSGSAPESILEEVAKAEEKIKLFKAESQNQHKIILFKELSKQVDNKDFQLIGTNHVINQLIALGEKDNVNDLYYKQIFPKLQNEFYDLVERLKKGEKSAELKLQFNQLKQEYVRLSHIFDHHTPWGWKSFTEKDKDNNSIYGNMIFTLYEDSLAIHSNTAWVWRGREYRGGEAQFGIDPNNDDLIKTLQDIYYLYECLGNPEQFYIDLLSHTKSNVRDQAAAENEFGHELPDHFDEKVIIDYLLKYARNELTIFAEGKRENASYMKRWYHDDQDIKSFGNIQRLYQRIDKEAVLIETLPTVFDRLLASDQAFVNHQDMRFEYHKYRPIHRYIEMTRNSNSQNQISPYQSQPKQSQLSLPSNDKKNVPALSNTLIFSDHASENQLAVSALEYSINKCISDISQTYATLTHKCGKAFEKATNKIFALYSKSLQEQGSNINAMLVILADLLNDFPKIYADDIYENLYKQLLNNLKNNKVTADFFNLNGIDFTNKIRSSSYDLAKAIKNKTYKLNYSLNNANQSQQITQAATKNVLPPENNNNNNKDDVLNINISPEVSAEEENTASKNFSFAKEPGEWAVSETKNNPFDMEQRFWQFRISVLPTKANLKKAISALDKLYSQDEYTDGNHPTTKIVTPGGYWDALRTPPLGNITADRDQLGKEICVYMEYDSDDNNYQYSSEYYKDLMLKMWKALEDAGVKLSYITPQKDELEIPCDSGILTPFFYSCSKPYTVGAGARHGLLLSENPNPKNFPDPIADINISFHDLKKYNIKNYDAYFISQNRLTIQEERISNANKILALDLSRFLESLEDNTHNPLRIAISRVSHVLNIEDDNTFISEANKLYAEYNTWADKLPRLPDIGLPHIFSQTEFEYLLNQANPKPLKDFLARCLETVNREMTAISNDINTPWIREFCQKNNINITKLNNSIQTSPIMLQQFYRRFKLLERAQDTFKREKARLTSSKSDFIELMRNISTSDDPMKFISKINIHEINDVKDLNSLMLAVQSADFPLLSNVFSLFNASDRQITIKKILDRFSAIIKMDETNPFAHNPEYKAIHHATYYGATALMEEILEANDSDLNAAAEYNRTPLHIATYNNHIEAVKFLLSKNVNITAQTIDKLTALDIAVERALLYFQGASQNPADKMKFLDCTSIINILVSKETIAAAPNSLKNILQTHDKLKKANSPAQLKLFEDHLLKPFDAVIPTLSKPSSI